MNRLSRTLLTGTATLMLVISAAGASHAANVYLKTGQGFQQDWNMAETWSDGQAVGSGNKYYVGRDASGGKADIKFTYSSQRKRSDISVRTPGGDVTFPGEQLTIDTSGTLYGKSITPINIPQLIMRGNGAVMSAFGPNSTIILAGKITFQDTPEFVATDAGRGIQLESMLDGDGVVKVINYKTESTTATIDASRTIFTVTNDFNLFGGAFDVHGFTFLAKGKFVLQNVSMMTINSDAIFDTETGVDVVASNMTMVVKKGGKVNLDSNLTLKKLIINGNEISDSPAQGLDMASLDAKYPGQFTGNGRLILPIRKARKSGRGEW